MSDNNGDRVPSWSDRLRRTPRIRFVTVTGTSSISIVFKDRMDIGRNTAVFRFMDAVSGNVYQFTNFTWSDSRTLVSSTSATAGTHSRAKSMVVYMSGNVRGQSRFRLLEHTSTTDVGINATPYAVNLGSAASRIKTGAPNICIVGDSIFYPQTSNRLFAGLIKNLQVPFRGAALPAVAAGTVASGYECASQLVNGSGNLAVVPPRNASFWRPGEAIPSGQTDVQTMPVRLAAFGGDYFNFGTPISFRMIDTDVWESNPDASQNAKVGALFYGTAKHPLLWRVRGRDRANATLADTTMSTLRTLSHVFVESATFNRGTGATTVVSDITSFNETEGPAAITDFNVLKVSFRYTDKTTGAFWTYFGYGGFTTKCHLDAGESLNLEGLGTYLVRYSDAAIDAEIAAFGLDTFIIMLGQNSAGDEWNGINIGNYSVNINAVADRLIARGLAAGKDPKVIFISTYDTSDTNSKFTQMENALVALSSGRKSCIKLRQLVQDTYGSWSAWQATLLADGVHPNATGRNALGALIAGVIQGA